MKVDVRVVNVEAWVTGNSGGTVTDLKPDDFSILENKVQQSITNFSPVNTPYDVLLLFDRSGSTEGDWKTMQKAADGFIANLRPQDRAGIANFDTSFRMLTRWTASREQLRKTVAGLTDGKRPGGTAFYKAVEMSLAAELLPVAGRRRALVVLTDGRDNSLFNTLYRQTYLPKSQEEPEFYKMLELARRERVPIYIVTISNDGAEVSRLTERYSPSTAAAYLNAVAHRLEDLAEAAGGRVLFPRRLQDIVPLYGQISRELGTAYSFGYVSNLPASNQGFREITVVAHDKRLHVLQSRPGYVSP
jgi:VWFA-related protein